MENSAIRGNQSAKIYSGSKTSKNTSKSETSSLGNVFSKNADETSSVKGNIDSLFGIVGGSNASSVDQNKPTKPLDTNGNYRSKVTDNVSVTSPRENVKVGQTISFDENIGVSAKQKHEDGSSTEVNQSFISVKDKDGKCNMTIGHDKIAYKDKNGEWKTREGLGNIFPKEGLSDFDVSKDGTITAYSPDGQKVVVRPDGSVNMYTNNSKYPSSVIAPDGTVSYLSTKPHTKSIED